MKFVDTGDDACNFHICAGRSIVYLSVCWRAFLESVFAHVCFSLIFQFFLSRSRLQWPINIECTAVHLVVV